MDKDRQKSPAKRTVKESGPHLSKWSPRESEDAQLAKTALNFKVGPTDRSDQLPFKSTHSTMDKDRQGSPGKSVTAKECGPHRSKWSPRESEDAQLAKAFLADLSDQLPTNQIQKFVPEPYVPSVQSMQHYCVLKNVHSKTNYLSSVIQLLHHNHAFRHYVHENASYGPMHTALVELFDQMDLMIYEKQAAKWAQSIYRAMEYLGDVGIVHRAIQPKHILLKTGTTDSDIIAKLSSFRDAAVYWDPVAKDLIDQPCKPVSKRAYLGFQAPEIFGSSGEFYNPVKADVWSFGASIFFIAARVYPYNLKTPGPNLDAEIGTTVSGSKLSEGAKTFFTGVLRANTNNRTRFDGIANDSWFKSA